MLTCYNCDNLVDDDIFKSNRCIILSGGELKVPPFEINSYNDTTTTFIINNPYKFGCLFHTKLQEYYKRITREDLIPKDDPRIKV